MSNDKKLKIAMIGHKRIPSREGGVEIVVYELSNLMAKAGNRVDVYNRSGAHVSGAEFKSDNMPIDGNIKIITVPTPKSKTLNAFVYSFLAAVRSLFGRYDVVHFHAEGPAAMCFLPKIFGIRTLVTIHGLDWQRSKWGGFASKYLKFGEKTAAKYADEIIVLYKLEKDGYILYLGRIVPEKGIHYLIDAYSQIDTQMPLVIAGGSSHSQEYFEELKQKAQGKNIIFTDFVQGRVLEELYSNAYVYVLPSDLEGMPISLLEAMSYGNCCLTSDIPECTEVCGDKAVCFEKGNTASLKKQLELLLKNSATRLPSCSPLRREAMKLPCRWQKNCQTPKIPRGYSHSVLCRPCRSRSQKKAAGILRWKIYKRPII